MNKNEYILAIPSWFPSRVDLFNGDFNERMVESFSKKKYYVVVYVIGDKNIKKQEIVEVIKKDYTIVYGYFSKSDNSLIAKPINISRYINLYIKLISNYISENGKPLFIHTYVFFPAGFISWYFARKEKIKNILTENYTIFYESMPKNIHNDYFPIKFLKKKILNSFDLIMPVAFALKKQMIKIVPYSNYKVLPNVVNISLFNYFEMNSESMEKSFNFIHISTMGYQKNPQLLLASFEKFLFTGKESKLKLIGSVNNIVLEIIKNSKLLSQNVAIVGEKTHNEVSEYIKSSDCLVLTSRFENLPCVILEALCCGLPVISTNVGGVKEVINDDNGIIIESENEEQLLNAFHNIFDNYSGFDKSEISKQAINKFSYENVCEEFYDSLSEYHIL